MPIELDRVHMVMLVVGVKVFKYDKGFRDKAPDTISSLIQIFEQLNANIAKHLEGTPIASPTAGCAYCCGETCEALCCPVCVRFCHVRCAQGLVPEYIDLIESIGDGPGGQVSDHGLQAPAAIESLPPGFDSLISASGCPCALCMRSHGNPIVECSVGGCDGRRTSPN